MSYIHPQEPQARDAGMSLEQLADILLLQIKPEKRLQAQDAQQIAERTDLDRQLQAPAAAGERLRQKNVPIKYQFIIATSASPFHKNNNKWFLHYFPVSHAAQSKHHCQDQKVPARDCKPDSSALSCRLLREPAEPLSGWLPSTSLSSAKASYWHLLIYSNCTAPFI